MTFPLAHHVQYRRHVGVERDARGNVVDVWAEPVPVPIFGWHVARAEEPQIAGHDRVRVDVILLAPESFTPGPKDRVVVSEAMGEFEVIGPVEDFNHGPFGWRPGNQINLKKVTG